MKGGLYMAPGTGFEPATSKLTASCSTAELSRTNAPFLGLYKVLAIFVMRMSDYIYSYARGQTDTYASSVYAKAVYYTI